MNFGYLNTKEVVCEVVEGDITQMVVQFQDKLGNVCEGNIQFAVVGRELPKQLRQGKVFNIEAGKQALRNINSVSLFFNIEVNPRPDEKNDGGIIVEIKLRELEQKSAQVSTEWSIVPGRGRRPTLVSAMATENSKLQLFNGFPKYVKIVEVGPRDGFQNEKSTVPTNVKVELIHKLVSSGLPVVEATSFVSPKWLPQLADAKDVMKEVKGTEGARLPLLTPNIKGFEAAVAAGANEVVIFASASESFSKSNINYSIDESLVRYRDVTATAKEHSIPVRGLVGFTRILFLEFRETKVELVIAH